MSDEYRIDSHKLMFHPQRVAKWLSAGDDWEKLKSVYPIYIEMSPTGICNHRCIFCGMDYIGYKPRSLDYELMPSIISEMADLGVKSIMFAGEGEPLLYKDIIKLTKLTHSAGIDVAFTTNGVLMNKNFVDKALRSVKWIKVSIDAGTDSTYKLIHGTEKKDFNTVLDNLKYAVAFREKEKISCTLGAQMLLLPENADEIETLAKLCRDTIGLDYLIIKPYSQHMYSHTKRYKDLDYASFEQKAKSAIALSTERFQVIYRGNAISRCSDDSARYRNCHAVPFFWAHVMSNHDVYSCSAYLQNTSFLLGNLKKDSFRSIWEGQKRKGNFEMMNSSFDINTCRINCRMSSINEYLQQLKAPGEHDNFI